MILHMHQPKLTSMKDFAGRPGPHCPLFPSGRKPLDSCPIAKSIPPALSLCSLFVFFLLFLFLLFFLLLFLLFFFLYFIITCYTQQRLEVQLPPQKKRKNREILRLQQHDPKVSCVPRI
jgi:hypothetical protein